MLKQEKPLKKVAIELYDYRGEGLYARPRRRRLL